MGLLGQPGGRLEVPYVCSPLFLCIPFLYDFPSLFPLPLFLFLWFVSFICWSCARPLSSCRLLGCTFRGSLGAMRLQGYSWEAHVQVYVPTYARRLARSRGLAGTKRRAARPAIRQVSVGQSFFETVSPVHGPGKSMMTHTQVFVAC